MVRREKFTTPSSSDQTRAETIRTLQDHQGDLPCGVPAPATSCRDSLLYEQWATTRDLSWMRLMKSRLWVKVMRSKLRRTKARMWEGSSVMGVDKRIV